VSVFERSITIEVNSAVRRLLADVGVIPSGRFFVADEVDLTRIPPSVTLSYFKRTVADDAAICFDMISLYTK
jgi:hypothetical protein